MPANKKTDVTENYPWLVYSQDIDAIENSGGGGGGGDASTATVTYTLTGGKSELYVEAAIAAEKESGKGSYPNFQTEETSGSFTVLLYSGNAFALFGESIVTVVSGDAEADGDMLTVTGDCTVTVNPD